MAVIIEGMEMPESCSGCEILHTDICKKWWNLTREERKTKKADGCPLREIKTGQWKRELIRNEHGGCIGAKMICSECGQDNRHDEYMKFCPNCGTRMEV